MTTPDTNKIKVQSQQIIVVGSNQTKEAYYPVVGKPYYPCANSYITRGITLSPQTLDDCFLSYPGVYDIAQSVGFFIPGSINQNGITGLSGYTFWTGYQTLDSLTGFTSTYSDVYFDTSSEECNQIMATEMNLGPDWLGCLWGTPEAPYNCSCPDIQPKFEAYVKLRLNVASFWNTPVETPVKRAEFMDALQYGKKVDVTIAGDFKIKIGQVVSIRIDGISNYPYASSAPYLNGYYYITGIKHVLTNSGTHESCLALTQIVPDTSSLPVSGACGACGAPYYS